MERKILPYLVVISALSVSLSAAFYSVTGIGKMFSGSANNVMLMMATLEIAKLILASMLYQYWDKLNILLKTYYFIAIFTLMAITSAGIYGYLSSAYSETSNKVENIEKQVAVLDVKRSMFVTQLGDIRTEKQRINDNIADLTKGLSNNVQQYKDKITGAILSSSSGSNRKAFEEQLRNSQKRRDDISLKETALSDSISKIDLLKLDLETNTDVAQEIGPLKYIAKLTGKTTDIVVNWFIIALMLVFDPLAVSLVVGANIIFRDKNKEKEKIDLSKEIDKKIDDFKKLEDDFKLKSQEFESKSLEIEKQEDDFNNKVLIKEQELELKNKELTQKEKSLIDKFEEKENNLESNIKDREGLLESRMNEREKELDSKILTAKLSLENLEVEEDKLKSKIKREEDRLKKIESELVNDRELVKDEKKSLSELKKELSVVKKTLEEDRLDLNLEWFKLEDAKQQLLQTQKDIEAARENLYMLDNEIKNWENQHWKMKRNPPPSAIIE